MKNLLILPFDHRSSLAKKLLNKDYQKLTAADKKKLRDLKDLVYQGFLKVYKKAENKQDFAVLVDEEFGGKILKDAKKKKIQTILTTEKTSSPVFDFEYGKNFDKHIEKIKPNYVKVLVRYNPQNSSSNEEQLKKLKQISDYCVKKKYPLLFELLVPPTEADLKKTVDEKHYYQSSIRLQNTVKAINEIQQAKIMISVWKLEGFTETQWPTIIENIKNKAQIVVLGRGENKIRVVHWLSAAKQFEPIIGFAVGRTVFLRPLQKYLAKEFNKQQTVEKIASNFEFFTRLWLR